MVKEFLHSGLLFLARQMHGTRCRGRGEKKWPEGIVVSGFFSEFFGVARSAELTALKLEALGFKVIRHDLREVLGKRPYFSKSVPGPQDYGWFIHANAPEATASLLSIDPKQTPSGVRLGYWAWELEVPPKGWSKLDGFFDEVIVPSRFTEQSFLAEGMFSRTLSHPMSKSPTTRLLRPSSVQFAKNFMVQMDGNSSFARKNIVASITAFTQAFGKSKDHKLFLKTRNLQPFQSHFISKSICGIDNIIWIDGLLREQELLELWTDVDVVVSTHRSEGFGLSLAEAAWSNRPVIATGWSGNMDFMQKNHLGTLPFKLIRVQSSDDVYGWYSRRNALWADVSVDDVSESMTIAFEGGLVNQPFTIRNKLRSLEDEWECIRPGTAFNRPKISF